MLHLQINSCPFPLSVFQAILAFAEVTTLPLTLNFETAGKYVHAMKLF